MVGVSVALVPVVKKTPMPKAKAARAALSEEDRQVIVDFFKKIRRIDYEHNPRAQSLVTRLMNANPDVYDYITRSQNRIGNVTGGQGPQQPSPMSLWGRLRARWRSMDDECVCYR
jgi:hypothetical protein